MINILEMNCTHEELVSKVNEIILSLNEKETRKSSEVSMTREMAIRVISGDLKDAKHKDAAEALGLTYGQIYSARKGFTFKDLTK